MQFVYNILIPFIAAMIATFWIHPKILKIALLKNLVDNPDARKLQRSPVPVMGGIAVFFGIIIGLSTSQFNEPSRNLFILIAAMIIMLYIGAIDDILNLSPKLRFIVEVCVILTVMLVNDVSINDFYGLWGISTIPSWLSIPLTATAAVGIINAINMIDGVNGLSSSICIFSSSIFAIMFYASENYVMANVAVSAVGALIPFFLHNVFGRSTKMFIGDSGALLMGILMSMFAIEVLNTNSPSRQFALQGMSIIAFTLATLAIPVFDTLRVMSSRILHRRSPFSPDKTHLHHLFIELGFTHVGTTIAIMTFNTIILLLWWLSYTSGADFCTQLYIVLGLGILFTFVFYNVTKRALRKGGNTLYIRSLKRIGKFLRIEINPLFAYIQKIIDKL